MSAGRLLVLLVALFSGAASAGPLVLVALGGSTPTTFTTVVGVRYYYSTSSTGPLAAKTATTEAVVTCTRDWFLDGELPPAAAVGGNCFADGEHLRPRASWSSQESLQVGVVMGLAFIVAFNAYSLGRVT